MEKIRNSYTTGILAGNRSTLGRGLGFSLLQNMWIFLWQAVKYMSNLKSHLEVDTSMYGICGNISHYEIVEKSLL